MNLYSKKQRWKVILLFAALIICAVTIWYASHIANKVRSAEKQRIDNWGQAIQNKANLVKITNEAFVAKANDDIEKVKIWVEATQEMQKELNDYSFALSIIQRNTEIPLILTENGNYSSAKNMSESQLEPDSIAYFIDKWGKEIEPITINYADNKSQKIYYRYSDTYYNLQEKRNSIINSFNTELVNNNDLVPVLFIDSASGKVLASNLDASLIEDQTKVKEQISHMKKRNIKVKLDDGVTGIIYYSESSTLTQLAYYPYILLGIIGLFSIIAYLLFSTFRRAEQNQVWVGMAKETAHQLGTPLSSLMGWIELLKAEGAPQSYLDEMNKDVARLHTVSERFSKIGSTAQLVSVSANDFVSKSMSYLEQRKSDKVSFVYDIQDHQHNVKINEPLFNWVIENLVNNGIDAMEGVGTITTKTYEDNNVYYIEISDTGKGIPAGKMKTVFEPGFTTKKRGWGLGLSLAKRIITEHHHGKIMVKSSEIGKGTTFQISLPMG